MKKLISSILSIVMLCTLTVPAFAADKEAPVIVDYGDGYYLKVSTVDSLTPFTIYERSITRKAEAYHGSIYIGTFYLNGTFQYDTVTSKATADSWSASSSYGYSGDSWRSGASVKGKCTFNYAGGKTYTITMTCDKNGNMSYTQ
ncbi:hypothetical protein [Agathobaculum desmolans]|uniref:hypothetical protein n=1 Tax=Agathobaculum desmolans TaxID=39484 RepID=UPI0012B59E81|nr:hypothetical protein [Agathobaculum desmolans]